MHGVSYFERRLSKCSKRPLKGMLTRKASLELYTRWVEESVKRGDPVKFLSTSGRPNRYNPAGVECFYFAEDERTAQWECERGLPASVNPKQSVVELHAKVLLHSVLDLLDPANMSTLGLTPRDLRVNWRKHAPAATQMLGAAVARTKIYSAIQYPSVAAQEQGEKGVCVVIFKERLKSPDSVDILGGNRLLEHLP